MTMLAPPPFYCTRDVDKLTASFPWFSRRRQSSLVIQKVVHQVAAHHESSNLFMQSLSKPLKGLLMLRASGKTITSGISQHHFNVWDHNRATATYKHVN